MPPANANRNDDVLIQLAEIKGMLSTLSEKVDGQVAQLASSITFGDRTNAQAIEFVKASVERAHDRLNSIMDPNDGEFARRDEKIAANRRLVWTSLIGPVVTAFIIALLLYSIGLK